MPRYAPALSPLWLLVAVSISLALGAGPSFRFAEATARQLLDPPAYSAAVLAPDAAGEGGAGR